MHLLSLTTDDVCLRCDDDTQSDPAQKYCSKAQKPKQSDPEGGSEEASVGGELNVVKQNRMLFAIDVRFKVLSHQ